jgi:hypothetical protein
MGLRRACMDRRHGGQVAGDMVDTCLDAQLTRSEPFLLSLALFARRWWGLWEMWETRSVFQVLWEGAKQLSIGRQLP